MIGAVEFDEWAHKALGGAWKEYYRGRGLSAELDKESHLPKEEKNALAELRSTIWLAVEGGQVTLAQRRIGKELAYCAYKLRDPKPWLGWRQMVLRAPAKLPHG